MEMKAMRGKLFYILYIIFIYVAIGVLFKFF